MEWEALKIVMCRLDGQALAVSSSVCRLWRNAATDEHLWENICRKRWPSLATPQGKALVKTTTAAGSYKAFFAMRYTAQHGRSDSSSKRPWLGLHRLVFLLEIEKAEAAEMSLDSSMCPCTSLIVHMAESNVGGDSLLPPPPQLFQFCKDVEPSEALAVKDMEEAKTLTVSWAVVLLDDKGENGKMKQVMRSSCKPGLVVGNACTFSEALPENDGCCCLPTKGLHLSEMSLRFDEDLVGGSYLLKEVCFGLLNNVSLRYFSLDEGLLYLQHAFL